MECEKHKNKEKNMICFDDRCKNVEEFCFVCWKIDHSKCEGIFKVHKDNLNDAVRLPESNPVNEGVVENIISKFQDASVKLERDKKRIVALCSLYTGSLTHEQLKDPDVRRVIKRHCRFFENVQTGSLSLEDKIFTTDKNKASTGLHRMYSEVAHTLEQMSEDIANVDLKIRAKEWISSSGIDVKVDGCHSRFKVGKGTGLHKPKSTHSGYYLSSKDNKGYYTVSDSKYYVLYHDELQNGHEFIVKVGTMKPETSGKIMEIGYGSPEAFISITNDTKPFAQFVSTESIFAESDPNIREDKRNGMVLSGDSHISIKSTNKKVEIAIMKGEDVIDRSSLLFTGNRRAYLLFTSPRTALDVIVTEIKADNKGPGGKTDNKGPGGKTGNKGPDKIKEVSIKETGKELSYLQLFVKEKQKKKKKDEVKKKEKKANKAEK